MAVCKPCARHTRLQLVTTGWGDSKIYYIECVRCGREWPVFNGSEGALALGEPRVFDVALYYPYAKTLVAGEPRPDDGLAAVG